MLLRLHPALRLSLLKHSLCCSFYSRLGCFWLLVSAPGNTCLGMLVGVVRVARSHPNSQEPTDGPKVAILIPAHNEASGIGRTLERLKQEVAPGDRIVVVADNCFRRDGDDREGTWR